MLLLLLLEILVADDGVAELGEALYGGGFGGANHRLLLLLLQLREAGILEDGRGGGDDDGALVRGYTEGDGDDAGGRGGRLEDVGCAGRRWGRARRRRRRCRGTRGRPGGSSLERRRWCAALGALRVILEGDVVVRMLRLRQLALACRLEGNVTLCEGRKKNLLLRSEYI